MLESIVALQEGDSAVSTEPLIYAKLWEIRTFSGMVPGSLESWLVLRSLRTLNLVSDTRTIWIGVND